MGSRTVRVRVRLRAQRGGPWPAGLHRVALVPGALHARRPRRAREGCHRATERGLQPPAPSLSIVQRQKRMWLTHNNTLYVMNGASSGVRGPLR